MLGLHCSVDFSLAAASRGYAPVAVLLQLLGFLQWLLLWGMGSRALGLQ